jgi:hypothetical protein
VSILKHQTITAMDQAKKSSALSKKLSSLEDQMSILMAKVVQLKECDLYMTKIIEAASEQFQCKSLGTPKYFFRNFCLCWPYSRSPGICLDPVAEDRRVSKRAAALERVSSDTNTFWADARRRSAMVLLHDRAHHIGRLLMAVKRP